MNFYQTMQKLGLANQPNWTVSTLQKAPIDPKAALAAHFDPDTVQQWLQFAKDPDHSLVTLEELYAEPNTPINQIALRVNIDKQHVMLIDMERDYDHAVKPILKHLPAVYGERSRHGGLHYIVPVPENILTDPKYVKLFNRTQVKFGQEDVGHSGVEIFFHNHFLTFTQNQVKTANNNTDEDLKMVLDYLVESVNTKQIQQHTFIDDQSDIPTDALVIAKHILTPKSKRQIKHYIEKNTDADNSYREYINMLVIATHMMKSVKSHYAFQPFGPDELIDQKAPYDPKMLAWVLLHLTYQFLPFRDKWNKISSGDQTYIQLTCNKVLSFVLNPPDDQEKSE